MAWNQSNTALVNKRRKTAHRKSSVGTLGILCGIGGALLVCIITSFYLDSNTEPDSVIKSSKAISEVTPDLERRNPRKSPEQIAAEEYANDKTSMPTRVGELRNGYRMLANGRLHKVHSIVTNAPTVQCIAYHVFTEPSDQSIGELLLIDPGTPLLGHSSEYYDGFDKDLLRSFDTPIVIAADDNEEVRLLKQEVSNIRDELKRRMDAGEDVVKIMRETREQFRELAIYKDDIEKMVKENAINLDNEKDFTDLVNAANQMLEDRGASPLTIPDVFKSVVRQWRREAIQSEKGIE